MSERYTPRGYARRMAGIAPFRLVEVLPEAARLLREPGVALTSGLDFGRYRAGEHIRFSYTRGLDRLELAVKRLAGASR